ncbi:Pre-mRNA-splicing factor 38A [Porphyridium purpureum]|uniref:Pre-mRNA-splicing factor 38 n=1 Tax=Porphyridium purpureum TaxID=35688 RepID=A0A5J4YS13_PORPP|nr:Pre-mRNA-splicing factor 38A [Porphyridium purpureum]|eukprot:POR5415..scf229_5
MAQQATSTQAIRAHGLDPQKLVDKITRSKVYASEFWLSRCFALDVAGVVEVAAKDVHAIGALYGGSLNRAHPFLCLLVKLLQLGPAFEVAAELVQQHSLKYLRALGAAYIRMTAGSAQVYSQLEPLYADFRKLRVLQTDGSFTLIHMDEFVDELLHDGQGPNQHILGIPFVKLQKRSVLEQTGQLEPYISVVRDELEREIALGTGPPLKRPRIGSLLTPKEDEQGVQVPYPTDIDGWNALRAILGLRPLE